MPRPTWSCTRAREHANCRCLLSVEQTVRTEGLKVKVSTCTKRTQPPTNDTAPLDCGGVPGVLLM